MITVATFTIDRSSLGLADLVIDGAAGDYTVQRDSFGLPPRSVRRTYAAASPWADGLLVVATALDQTTWVLPVLVQGVDADHCRAKASTLMAAVDQFSYDFTADLDGVVEVWAAEPADVTQGGPLTRDASAGSTYFWELTLSIPVYPRPS